jgi:hypothetical protein
MEVHNWMFRDSFWDAGLDGRAFITTKTAQELAEEFANLQRLLNLQTLRANALMTSENNDTSSKYLKTEGTVIEAAKKRPLVRFQDSNEDAKALTEESPSPTNGNIDDDKTTDEIWSNSKSNDAMPS